MPQSGSRRYWNQKIETMSEDDIKEFQLRRLKKQLNCNYEHSSYYRRKYEEAGLKPEEMKTMDDLRGR